MADSFLVAFCDLFCSFQSFEWSEADQDVALLHPEIARRVEAGVVAPFSGNDDDAEISTDMSFGQSSTFEFRACTHGYLRQLKFHIAVQERGVNEVHHLWLDGGQGRE